MTPRRWPWAALALAFTQLLATWRAATVTPSPVLGGQVVASRAALRPGDPDALLWALQKGNETRALELLNGPGAEALLKRRSRRHDCTALMLAAGASGCPASDAVVQKILSFGSAANVAARSRSYRTAADYAALHPTCAHWSPRLRALASQEIASTTSGPRCPCCGQALGTRRPRIASLAERYLRGQHQNLLLERFFRKELESRSEKGGAWNTLMRPEFHIFHKSRTFHKELSESLAVLDEIQQSCPEMLEDPGQWHFLDLCSGKSLTSLLLSTATASALAVLAVDRIGAEGLPHYQEAGLPVEYLQQDLMDPGCLTALISKLRRGRRHVALAGLHLCGNLSVKAVEIFRELPSLRVCILVPCCLPHMRDAPLALKHLYRQSVADDEQYSQWVGYLEAQLAAIPNVLVRKTVALHMKSKKNTVLTAIKGDTKNFTTGG